MEPELLREIKIKAEIITCTCLKQVTDLRIIFTVDSDMSAFSHFIVESSSV